MEHPTNSNGAADLFSSEYDGGDIIMLPGKKKKKQKNQVSNKIVKPKLSKSQKRKLKKLEEEKEKEVLLSKSIETLEKYKIGENVYSLMWSSRNLGQVETMREKRRREIEFSKAGLELPESDRPLKKKMSDGASQDIEFKNGTDDIALKPCLTNRAYLQDKTVSVGENLDCGNGICLISDGGGASSVQENSIEAIEPLPKLSEKPTLSFSSNEEVIKPMDMMYGDSEAKDSCHKKHESLHLETNLTAPTVIHVSRPKEIEKQRRDLPILMMEQEIMEAINENICVIICGETGCGKTTQVPQFLYEAGFGSKIQGGIIGVTQPRRVAVLATAKRVAFELGFRVGKEVGFQVRHDRRVGENCAIKIMTDGILLREVQNDFLLKRYSVIILDEAHARSLNTDILIGMLSRVILERRRIYKEQQERILSGETIENVDMIYPLKLILMSATLRVEDFVSGRKIFPDPPVTIEVPARQYPVTVHFSKKTEIVDYVGQAFKKIMSIHKNLPPGGILVFVTGQNEVEFLCKKLRRASREIVENEAKGSKNSSSSITEEKTLEDNDMEEISEAYEFQGSSVHDIADRFGSNMMEEEDADFEEIESDSSYDSEESDLEFYSDDEDHSKLGPVESEASLASLRAAFLALDAKKGSIQDTNNKNFTEAPEGEPKQSFPDIKQVVKKDKDSCVGPMQVLPLYAMLPTSAHDRVFEGVKDGERLVVVATNVAETSLTIPGIRYVVDTGREKVKNYNTSNGMENYEIQWISKASAKQRTGRAGRTGPGHCYRLYSSAVYSNIFPDFSTAEILKVPVDGVVLLMKSMHIGKVANFPFPTPPDSSALIEAERCLKVLEALDDKGRLTPLGNAMGRYPMSPRHSRMLLTVIQNTRDVKNPVRANLLLGYAVASAAALSLQNPFIFQFEGNSEGKIDKEEKSRIKKLKERARISRNKFANPTSDSLSVAFALQCYEHSTDGAEFCREHNLHNKTMEEMSKLRKQLLQLVFKSDPDFSWPQGKIEDVENTWSIFSEKCPLGLDEEGILGQAICAGWADRVAKRVVGPTRSTDGERNTNGLRYQACYVKETIFLHRRSSLAKSPPEFLVYSELLFSKRPYVHVATSVSPSWLVQYARPMCAFSAPILDQKPFYDVKDDKVLSLVKPIFGPHLWELPNHRLPIKDDSGRAIAFAYCLLEGDVLPVLKESYVRDKMAGLPAIMLKPEALGLKRVGNLLNKLIRRGRIIDSCGKLRSVWEENPRELFDEIKDWFRKDFHGEFMEDLWRKMQREVLFDPKKRFPKNSSREKKRI